MVTSSRQRFTAIGHTLVGSEFPTANRPADAAYSGEQFIDQFLRLHVICHAVQSSRRLVADSFTADGRENPAGSLAGNVSLTANLVGLAPGFYYAVVLFRGPDDGDLSLPVSLVVNQSTTVSATPDHVDFAFQASNISGSSNVKSLAVVGSGARLWRTKPASPAILASRFRKRQGAWAGHWLPARRPRRFMSRWIRPVLSPAFAGGDDHDRNYPKYGDSSGEGDGHEPTPYLRQS